MTGADAQTAGWLRVGGEVAEALRGGGPVVALESVIFSRLGLPEPANRCCFERVVAAVRGAGAVPALTGVLDGRAVVGADDEGARQLMGSSVKLGARDVGLALASGLGAGATTVSSSAALAAAAGIEVLATGGIGGVHRGAGTTGDISQDLVALSRYAVVVVSSGVKAFLDAGRTLEFLETLAVPVAGWRTDMFPAFYTRESGAAVGWTVQDSDEVAAAFRAGAGLAGSAGMLVANPIPASAELDPAMAAKAVSAALDAAGGSTGPAVTPAALEAVADATGGAAVEANLALAESNAAVAAEVAVALSRVGESP